jgi:hypothetical protein
MPVRSRADKDQQRNRNQNQAYPDDRCRERTKALKGRLPTVLPGSSYKPPYIEPTRSVKTK